PNPGRGWCAGVVLRLSRQAKLAHASWRAAAYVGAPRARSARRAGALGGGGRAAEAAGAAASACAAAAWHAESSEHWPSRGRAAARELHRGRRGGYMWAVHLVGDGRRAAARLSG